MNLFFIVLVFLFGVVIGSFLNVLIYRLPLGISVAHGFSMCPVCEHRLYPADLVPVVSWLFLGGKCRYCKAPIAPIYPFVELLNGVLWVAMAFRFGLSVECAAFAVVSSCLVVVAFVDWQHMEIPDSMNLAIALMGVLLLLTSHMLSWQARLLGFLVVSVPMVALGLLGAMGGGDIKLMAALGLCLGWRLTLFTVFFGALAGSAVYLLRRAKMGKQVPFGPFLSVGGIAAILWGEPLLTWYLGLLH